MTRRLRTHKVRFVRTYDRFEAGRVVEVGRGPGKLPRHICEVLCRGEEPFAEPLGADGKPLGDAEPEPPADEAPSASEDDEESTDDQ